LKNKKILIAVSGSIAAYKSASLIRLLVIAGAEVKVLMTESAKEFISPLTLSTLSKNKVYSDLIDEDSWSNHVELGLWADAMIVAPATANTIARMANGLCENIVTAVYLSARCPVYIAPAMDLDMWEHPSTQENIKKLLSCGNQIIDPEVGELASGLHGKGRMAEPENIMAFLSEAFDKKKDLTGKKVLITAGPTHERIDPVRYIGNRSSGKMGMALAEECARRGAEVVLILGPSSLDTNTANIAIERVVTAEEMYASAQKHHHSSTLCIFSAAVADYKPQNPASRKIKKSEEAFQISLQRTPDIANELGTLKSEEQTHIGFALETEHEEENALTKLNRKNFDMIVLNSLNDEGAGFGHDTNKVRIYGTKHDFIDIKLKPKSELAGDIINTFVEF
jgi:phosphopantothenoylcysteine decarboxylase/phosphopantothenate--cysteine ligase